MKHLKTLITLFLLIIGTSVSWAEFQDFEIDLMQATPTLPEGVTATDDGAHGPYYHGGHGWANYVFKFTTSKSVKITLQKCYYGNNACVKVADPKNGDVLTTLNTKQTESNCNGEVSWVYNSDGTAKDLFVLCGDYCHFAKVEAVEGEPTPAPYSVSFSKGSTDAIGTCPAALSCPVGDLVTIPDNYTMYKEGYTLTGWTDGAKTYAVGSNVTPAADMELTPVFTQNTVSIATCPNEVTVKFDFVKSLGAPAAHFENASAIWVTQAEVDGKTIDVMAAIDATTGKFESASNANWCQVNNGTKFTIPSCYNASVRLYCYYPTTATTIDGSTEYDDAEGSTGGYAIERSVTSTSNTVDVVMGENNYLKYIQVVIPHIETVASLNAVWDWDDLTEEEANFSHSGGSIPSNVPGVELSVDAYPSYLKYEVVNKSAQGILGNGAEIQVPIRHEGDIVKVTYSTTSKKLIIGGTEVTGSSPCTYTATADDAMKGYVTITTSNIVYLYRIEVQQVSYSDVLPVIKMNSQGWATFCCLNKNSVVKLPRLSNQTYPQAYIATKVDGENCKITLNPVNYFGYGEGVIIQGVPNATYYAQVTTNPSDVAGSDNLIEGCKETCNLRGKSNAYILATKTVGGEKKAGLYLVDSDILIPAGKAYIPIPNTTAKEFSFVIAGEEEATGVTTVEDKSAKSSDVYYNLSGQKVGKNYKGIVIGADGVKKLVK